MLLFLDFDGVLHPEPCFDKAQLFCCKTRFENVMREFVQCEIVISSTWRDTRSLDELRSFFSSNIAHRIIDVTPCWRDHPDVVDTIGYQRHAEIEAWLRQSQEPWRAWIALDDKPYLFRPFLKNLVKTEPQCGFNEASERDLRQKLSAC